MFIDPWTYSTTTDDQHYFDIEFICQNPTFWSLVIGPADMATLLQTERLRKELFDIGLGQAYNDSELFKRQATDNDDS